MEKLELLEKSNITNQEAKLKLHLIKKYEELGLEKTYIILAFRNQLLLNSCNIDENNFNYILFKNYIYFLNGEYNINLKNVPEKYEEMLVEFNNYVKNNNFEEALNLYENNVFIYEILCSSYLRNLPKSESEKINNIPSEKVDSIYNKIMLLQNTDLTFKRHQNVKKNVKINN